MITPRQAAFVGSRLLALYLLWQCAPQLFQFALVLWKVAEVDDAYAYAPFMFFGHLIAYLLGFLIFWFGAGYLSNKVFNEAVRSDEMSTWAFQPVVEAATMILGFGFILKAVPILVLITLGPDEPGARNYAEQLGEALVHLVLGLICLFGFRGISLLFVRLRKFRFKWPNSASFPRRRESSPVEQTF